MQTTQPDQAQIQHMMFAMMPVIGLFIVVAWAVVIIPFWQIFKKAGMGAPLSLLMILPIVNIVMLYVLAFSRWKVVPAPEFAMGYPPAYPPPGYVPAAPVYPPTAYPPTAAAPVAYVPPTDPPASI